MDLATNNLTTQNEILSKINGNNKTIRYYIEYKSDELFNALTRASFNQTDNTYSLSKDEFNLIINIVRHMKSNGDLSNLHSSCKQAINENKIYENILLTLNKK
jgi:hypothetical protein